MCHVCGKETEFYGTRKGQLTDVRKKAQLKEQASGAEEQQQQQQVNPKGAKKKKGKGENAEVPASAPAAPEPASAPAPAPAPGGFSFSSFLGIQVGKVDVPSVPPVLKPVGKPSPSLSTPALTHAPKPSGPAAPLPAGSQKPLQVGVPKPKLPGQPSAPPTSQKGKGEQPKGQLQGKPGHPGGPSPRIGEGVTK